MKAPDETTAQREAEVLQKRAHALARAGKASVAADRDSVEVLDFTVAGHRCALELCWLCEVRPLKELLALPLSSRPLVGLVQLRGRMLPVLDIPGLLDGGSPTHADPGLLLVLGRRDPEFGVGITAVHGLQSVSPGEAARRSGPVQRWRPEVVRGVTAAGLVILDGERLLSLTSSPASWPVVGLDPQLQ